MKTTNCVKMVMQVSMRMLMKEMLPMKQTQPEDHLLPDFTPTNLRLLSNRDRDMFLALLDAAPEPTEALKKAAE